MGAGNAGRDWTEKIPFDERGAGGGKREGDEAAMLDREKGLLYYFLSFSSFFLLFFFFFKICIYALGTVVSSDYTDAVALLASQTTRRYSGGPPPWGPGYRPRLLCNHALGGGQMEQGRARWAIPGSRGFGPGGGFGR